jgi:hypothetical protein
VANWFKFGDDHSSVVTAANIATISAITGIVPLVSYRVVRCQLRQSHRVIHKLWAAGTQCYVRSLRIVQLL